MTKTPALTIVSFMFCCSHVGFLNDIADTIAAKYNWTYQFKLYDSHNTAIGNHTHYFITNS